MDNCYLCGKKFNDNDVKKHDEHIIQQAVGGNLKENDILCSKCGEKLGREIDVPFNKIFQGIATRLDIKTDRNNSKSSSTKGKCIKFCNETVEFDVLWKDFKVSPLKPFHKYIENNKKVIIYANQKNFKKYKQKVESEIANNFGENNKPEIISCDDLDGTIEYPFNMDNQAFKKGLAKIAIGFASKYSKILTKLKKIQWSQSTKEQTLRDFNYQWIEFGRKSNINREELPLVLEIDNNTKQGKIKDEILAIQFYPLGIIDRLIEIQKNEFDHYPFHNLILFTLDYNPNISNGKKVLICYIELFSTFQWYVVLNDEYYGESIYECYAQNILKKDDYIIELGRRYYKERNIWLQPLGITEEYIDKKYNDRDDENKNRWDIEEELIQEETIKQKYKLNFEGYLHNIISGISRQVLLIKQKEQFQRPEFKDSYFGKFVNNKYLMEEYNTLFQSFDDDINFKKNLDLFFSQEYNHKYDDYDEIFKNFTYRRFYYEKDSYKNYYTELLENFKFLENMGLFKKYGYSKMFLLEQYIQEETIKQKMKE